MRTSRRYLAVDGRRVHYRVCGEGPPLVMLHGSPGDSQMLAMEMAAAASRFTCIALDTPGFGRSGALPGDVLTVGDLADATAAAMAALRLPPCVVYGTHTGAAIALELGLRSPRSVTGLVLEGLPMFTADESERLFAGYFAPMTTDPLGGHLFATWMRFRDQFTWFPWLSRDVARLNPVDRPSAAEVDTWVSMFYRSCRTYRPAYRAACFYGPSAFASAAASSVPTVYTAGAEDMLYPHLDRLPVLREHQRIERLPLSDPDKHEKLAGFCASLPQPGRPCPALPSSFAGHDPALAIVDGRDGAILVRRYGRPDAPALVLLHDAPGTGLALEALARNLATDLQVLVPDLPGNGESDAPVEGCSAVDAAVAAVEALVDHLALDRFTIGATGCGNAVALRYLAAGDARLATVVVDATTVARTVDAHAVAPDLVLSDQGAHWLQAWMMIRDGQIYAPWYDGRVAAQREDQGCFDADWLHDQTCALMVSRESYHRLPREVAALDTAPLLLAGHDSIRQVPLASWRAATFTESRQERTA